MNVFPRNFGLCRGPQIMAGIPLFLYFLHGMGDLEGALKLFQKEEKGKKEKEKGALKL